MAVRSIGSFALCGRGLPFAVWAPSPGLPVLRIVSEVHTTFSGTVGGPPHPPCAAWHESMRFFRVSQTTDNRFDAFRNLYLALESILSKIAPVKSRANGRSDEGEGEWT